MGRNLCGLDRSNWKFANEDYCPHLLIMLNNVLYMTCFALVK